MDILIVEDEHAMARMLQATLEHEGYRARRAGSLAEARDALAERPPDLIALDVMLPEGEDAGFAFARELRDLGDAMPILFLTARDALEDRVQGLDLGGDDYLVKPYSLEEFLARVRALLRRGTPLLAERVARGPLEVDLRRRRVCWRGAEVQLSAREYALLELFARDAERVWSPEELLDRIFPGASSGRRVVRVYVHYLRQKLGDEAVRTEPGGYRLGV